MLTIWGRVKEEEEEQKENFEKRFFINFWSDFAYVFVLHLKQKMRLNFDGKNNQKISDQF